MKSYYSKSSPSQGHRVASGSPMTTGSLRDEQEEKQRLEKSNFDLKMKVFYLEESLRRFQDGEDAIDSKSEKYRADINRLQIQLEEKQVDLEQRNLLLMKAKSAIEALKSEIERMRNEAEQNHVLEDRFRRLKQLNDNHESDHRVQVSQLEHQLAITRQALEAKDLERANLEDKMVSLRNFIVCFDNFFTIYFF